MFPRPASALSAKGLQCSCPLCCIKCPTLNAGEIGTNTALLINYGGSLRGSSKGQVQAQSIGCWVEAFDQVLQVSLTSDKWRTLSASVGAWRELTQMTDDQEDWTMQQGFALRDQASRLGALHLAQGALPLPSCAGTLLVTHGTCSYSCCTFQGPNPQAVKQSLLRGRVFQWTEYVSQPTFLTSLRPLGL